MTGVEWSGVESIWTIYHYKIQVEWTGVHWTPYEFY